MAINPPTPDKLVDGKTYGFFNLTRMDTYVGRTSWDGALYFNNANASNYVKLTAEDKGNGNWAFAYTEQAADETSVTTYMAVPAGTGNVNLKAEEPVLWNVTPGKYENYIMLMAGAGNNIGTTALPYHMHLNGGNEYIVVSFDGDSWYPDFYGGVLRDADGFEVYDDAVRYIMADSSSCNWAFVEVGNVENFMMKAQAYSMINNFEAQYCSEEKMGDDAAIFAKTLEAVTSLYEREDYCEYDFEDIKALINAKVTLFTNIQSAIAANEKGDAVLAAAISNAEQAFASTDDAAALTAAIEALAAALKNYQEAGGDITALIVNNSFEDLSVQGGSQTSGVAPAPAGWNVFVNGKQVNTIEDVQAAGISAWHGVNNDCDGQDGLYAFGIWTSSVPQYEISQKIEGLENGSYVVSALLMAGANGNGSRMTTQRIFANLNSQYFGLEEDYDQSLLNKGEVYTFAGNDQNFVTDRQLFPMEMRAYVYDGTITLGLRTDGNYRASLRSGGNGAGGDGWFKVDNFRLMKVENDPADAYNIFAHFFNTIDSYYEDGYFMSADLTAELETLVGKYGDLNAQSAESDLIAGILDCKDKVDVMTANIDAYTKLANAITNAWNNLEAYQDYPGVGDFADIISEVEEAYYEGTYSTDEALAAIKVLEDALQACIESLVVEPGKEITNWIKNPSFEDYSSQGNDDNSGGIAAPPTGWKLNLNNVAVTTAAEVGTQVQGWCAINHGDGIEVEDAEGNVWYNQYTDGEHLWGIWSGAVPSVELYQELNLPAGTYELSADIVVQNDWAGYNLATQRLFGGSYVTMFGDESYYETYLPEDAQHAKEIDNDPAYAECQYKRLSYAGNYKYENYGVSSIPYTTKVVFGTEGTEPVKIGFRTDRTDLTTGELSGQASMGWFKLDNFRLTCINLEVPDAISEVPAAAKNADKTYSVTGVAVGNDYKGIVIRNGKKFVVK